MLHVRPHALDLAQNMQLAPLARVGAVVEVQARASDSSIRRPDLFPDFLRFLNLIAACVGLLAALRGVYLTFYRFL
jgi:hypothetical protein